jgi:putative membrane protein
MVRHARPAWVPVGVLAIVAGLLLTAPSVAFAHGLAPSEPDASILLTGWSFDPTIWLPLLLAAVVPVLAARHVDRAHPANPVPRRRVAYWLAGVGVLLVALQSPIERYDTTLFSVHMVQHLLITMVAAPLLVLAAPVTLLLRAASASARKRAILPILHSRIVRIVSFPVVAWIVFTGYMFFSHFSPLFNASLEDRTIHQLEHAGFLLTAMLFWWPAIGVDPSSWRLPRAGRLLYMGLGMPFSSFLGLAIVSATGVLYPHYASLLRTWGMPPLEDQNWAGGIMWAGGDGLFLIALVLGVAAWLRDAEAEGRREDARLDREQAVRDRAASRSGAVPGPSAE